MATIAKIQTRPKEIPVLYQQKMFSNIISHVQSSLPFDVVTTKSIGIIDFLGRTSVSSLMSVQANGSHDNEQTISSYVQFDLVITTPTPQGKPVYIKFDFYHAKGSQDICLCLE